LDSMIPSGRKLRRRKLRPISEDGPSLMAVITRFQCTGLPDF
jgi:hypothetical protein